MSLPFNVPNETTKLIIVPEATDLASRVLAFRQAEAPIAPAAQGDAPRAAPLDPRVHALHLRRKALRSFSRSIQKASHRAKIAARHEPEIEAFARRLVERVLGGQPPHQVLQDIQDEAADDPTVNVLEALGTVIVDADSIDPAQLQACHALAIPNVAVPPIGSVSVPTFPPAVAVAVPGVNPNAWHLVQTRANLKHQQGLTGAGVTVGVLDSGIDAGHPEFAGKAISFQEFDAQGNMIASAPHDTAQHGTHVCGLVAGQQAGTAPAASLAVAAVLTNPNPSGGDNFGYLAQIQAGINWLLASQPPIYVLNGSFGFPGYSSYFYQSLQNALISPGSILIAAIGDSGVYGPNQHTSPGNYDIVTGVGATDQNNNVCAFSDWGTQGAATKPDLCAPGQSIWSSVPGGNYAVFNGTSMASPQVAATAALALQANPQLAANAHGLVTALRTLVQPLNGGANVARGGLGTLDLTTL